MIKIGVLTRYSRMGASTRLRTLSYLPYLRSAGFVVDTLPLFDDLYLLHLYAKQSTKLDVLKAFGRRVRQTMFLRDYDVIWIEKELFPWMPWLVEKMFFPKGIPIVSDFDDAVFHRYDQHSNSLVRRLLGSKIDKLMASCSLVTVGNTYLSERAIASGARNVRVLPTVVDATAYTPRTPSNDGATVRIGWIGTPSTWADYMAERLPLLEEVSASVGAVLCAIGAGDAVRNQATVEVRPWSEESEITELQRFDIGIMPLSDTPFVRGKCGYKLIQYMACGIPVVASPVGVNEEIVEHGVNGFLAGKDSEWRWALEVLARDRDLRLRMGEAGRKKFERYFSLQTWGPSLVDLMKSVSKAKPS